MSASLSFPTPTKWRKRKRETNLPTNSKKQKPEAEAADDDEDDDLDDDPELEEDDDLQPPTGVAAVAAAPATITLTSLHNSRESEVLSTGGTRISDFPMVIQHTVNRHHSSVLAIVSAEREIQYSNRPQNSVNLENISHGQLQALSAVLSDNPSLSDQDRSDNSVYVCTPPPIMEGRGVVKRYGNNQSHVLPMHADWFSPNSVHRLERQVVPHFFAGKSSEHTPEKYMDCRNRIVAKYMENPERRISVTDCQGIVSGVDVHDLNRIIRFLDHWAIINYNAPAPNREPRIGGTYLREDPNGEILIPSAALRSIYSLIHFDKPKSRIRPEDICSSSSCLDDEVPDLDSRIRERLSEIYCNYCSQPLPGMHYQSQKEADVMLCVDCFHDGKFVVGHSSIDYIRVNSAKDSCDFDGDNWTDQETLLLLEAVEIFNDNWNDIAEHVGSKSKAQCILHFIRLPMEDGILENIDVPRSVSFNAPNKEDCGKSCSNSNGMQDLEPESRLPFANTGNPVMALVAFLASSVGPRVAAACAHAALAALSKEDHLSGVSNSFIQMEGTVHGDRTSAEGMRRREDVSQGASASLTHQKDESLEAQGSLTENHALSAPLSTERVKNAAKSGLSAAAMKAKLFADHEEREIQRMTASIINNQLKRLELKLKQFAEVETLLLKECEQVERTRQRFAAERARIISTGFVPSRVNTGITIPGSAASALANNVVVNNRQPVISVPPGPGHTNMSGYGNNQATHPHMSFMPRQQQMFAFGPRLPLSAIHPSSSVSGPSASVMFNAAAAGNNTANLGHPILRPVSGTNTNVG